MFRKLLNNEKAANAVGTVVAILVVITIGLLVYWSISGSITITSTQGVIAQGNVNNTSQTVFTLAPIVAIVFIASIILAYITRFGGGGGGV